MLQTLQNLTEIYNAAEAFAHPGFLSSTISDLNDTQKDILNLANINNISGNFDTAAKLYNYSSAIHSRINVLILFQKNADLSFSKYQNVLLPDNVQGEFVIIAAKMSRFFADIQDYFYIIAYSSITISLVAVLFSIGRSFFSFQNLISKMRIGDFSEIERKIDIKRMIPTSSTMFLGVSVSSSYIGFYIIHFFCFGLLIFITNRTLRGILLPEFLNEIFLIGSTRLIKFLMDRSASKRLVDRELNLITRPGWWSFYFILSSAIGLIAATVSASIRILIFIMYSAFSILCVDYTILPKSFVRLDYAHTSYLSYMYSVHCYDNPTMQIAAEMFRNPLSGTSKARSRWKLAYTLLIDPQLSQYRKKAGFFKKVK
jgi:hypothetical protein